MFFIASPSNSDRSPGIFHCFAFNQEDELNDSDSAEYLPGGVDFYKIVLKMGVVKVAVKVAHAALGLHRTLQDDPRGLDRY